jgi:hypothetical protein
MFTDGERLELIEKLVAVLNAEKAGQEAKRAVLATLLADTTREFLKGKYKAGGSKNKKTGIVTLRDALADLKRKM